MKRYRLALTAFLIVILSGCGGSIQAIRTYDNETDFSGLASYDWLPMELATFSTPESSEHYKKEMDKMLTERGFNLDSNTPDFLIKTYRNEINLVEHKTIHGPYVTFRKTMLRVQFLHPTTKEAIYDGITDAYLEVDDTQEKKNAILDQAVEALLIEFPPGSE
jgi:hypothetical protein